MTFEWSDFQWIWFSQIIESQARQFPDLAFQSIFQSFKAFYSNLSDFLDQPGIMDKFIDKLYMLIPICFVFINGKWKLAVFEKDTFILHI